MKSWWYLVVMAVAVVTAVPAQDAPGSGAPAAEVPVQDDATALPVRRGEVVPAPSSTAAESAAPAEPRATSSANTREASASESPKPGSERKPSPTKDKSTASTTKKKPAQKSADRPAAKSGDGPETADRVTADAGREVFRQLSVGSAQAPFVLFLYGDLECPDSALFEAQLLPEVRRDFIDTGRIRLEARAMPLDTHPHAVQAEAAARCAGEQGRYWDMRRVLLANQSNLGTAAIEGYATDLGLDANAFGKSLKSGRWQEQVAEEKAQGAAAGIARTPTLVLARTQADGSLTHVWSAAEPKDYPALKRQLDRATGRRWLPF